MKPLQAALCLGAFWAALLCFPAPARSSCSSGSIRVKIETTERVRQSRSGHMKGEGMDLKTKLVMLLFVFCAAGCASLSKKPAAGIERENYTIRFTGYETVVEIKGTPEEVGKYMLQPRNYLNYKTGRVRFELTSPKVLEQVGDTVGYTITFAGVKMPMLAILVNYKPGREIWYFFTGENGVLADLKLYLEPFQGGTKVHLKYENEDLNPGLQEIQETLNMKETMAQAMEWAIAKGQQNFDPALKPEELLKEGIRGEFYDPIYDAYRASIWVNAPAKKVYEYLQGPARKKYEKEYGDWMGTLYFRADKGPFPARIDTDGINQELIGFPALSTYGRGKYGYHSTGYLMPQSHSYITKNQITVKSESGGAEVSINYLISSNRVDSTDMYELAIMETKLPAPVDRFLQNIKQDMEGGQK
jgi:hypothetical protein